jgi:hypothetical protein
MVEIFTVVAMEVAERQGSAKVATIYGCCAIPWFLPSIYRLRENPPNDPLDISYDLRKVGG